MDFDHSHVLWVLGMGPMGILWGSPQLFSVVWCGMGIKNQSPRQPCY